MKKRRILTVLIILTLVFIWIHSAVSREGSSAESRWVYEKLRWLLQLIFGEERATVHLLRKLAHFTEFFVLGTEAMMLGIDLAGCSKKTVGIVFLLCNFCALLDETIQIFSGRGSAVSDVWIDTAGAVTGILLVLAVNHLLTRAGRKCTDE